jgi:hypothetical protein
MIAEKASSLGSAIMEAIRNPNGNREENVKIIKTLLELGALNLNSNAQNMVKKVVIEQGDSDIVKLFMDFGMDFNQSDLDYAIQKLLPFSKEIVNFLLDLGIKPSEKTKQYIKENIEKTPSHSSFFRLNLEIADRILNS